MPITTRFVGGMLEIHFKGEIEGSHLFEQLLEVRDLEEREPVAPSRLVDLRDAFTKDVRFGEEWVAHLDQLKRLAGIVGLVIGLAFAAVALVIIGTTIRMARLQRTREIRILRLVGATDGFIRAPYLVEGALKGLLGGLVALALTWGAFALLRGAQPDVAFQPVFLPGGLVGLGLAAGTLLGLLASAVSVGRHLREV